VRGTSWTSSEISFASGHIWAHFDELEAPVTHLSAVKILGFDLQSGAKNILDGEQNVPHIESELGVLLMS
jgi:hypothetical protein